MPYAELDRVRLYYERGARFRCCAAPDRSRGRLGHPRAARIKPDLEVGITVGAGHFHHIEVPEQVNAMIERLLAVSL